MTTNISPTYYDDIVRHDLSGYGTWSDCHDGTGMQKVGGHLPGFVQAGYGYTDRWCYIRRSYFVFPSTALAGKLVVGAVLDFRCFYKTDDCGWSPSFVAVLFTPADPTNVVIADYQNFGDTEVSNEIAYLDVDTTNTFGHNLFTLTPTAITAIQAAVDAGDWICLGIREATYDVADVEPVWHDGDWNPGTCMQSYSGAVQLSVTVSDLAVSTDAATDISTTGATLNGTLSNDGGESSVTCSFEAGLTPACSGWSGGSQVVSMGNNYSTALNAYSSLGAKPGQTVYFRAKGVGADSGATAYGSVLSFRLGNYPSKPLTRVNSIHDVFRAGFNGQKPLYYTEIQWGGLGDPLIPAFQPYQPSIGDPNTGNPQTAPPPAQGQNWMGLYGQYLASRTGAQIRADFPNSLGGRPALNEFMLRYLITGGRIMNPPAP